MGSLPERLGERLWGLGIFLLGCSFVAAAAFAIGFVTGYVAGQEGPVFNLELENSTVSFCSPQNGMYNYANSTPPTCPEVQSDG